MSGLGSGEVKGKNLVDNGSGVSRDEENYKFLLLEDHGYLPAVIEEPIQDLLWAGAALRASGKGFSLKNYRS